MTARCPWTSRSPAAGRRTESTARGAPSSAGCPPIARSSRASPPTPTASKPHQRRRYHNSEPNHAKQHLDSLRAGCCGRCGGHPRMGRPWCLCRWSSGCCQWLCATGPTWPERAPVGPGVTARVRTRRYRRTRPGCCARPAEGSAIDRATLPGSGKQARISGTFRATRCWCGPRVISHGWLTCPHNSILPRSSTSACRMLRWQSTPTHDVLDGPGAPHRRGRSASVGLP